MCVGPSILKEKKKLLGSSGQKIQKKTKKYKKQQASWLPAHILTAFLPRCPHTHTPSTHMWYFGEDDAEDDDKSDGSTSVDDPCVQQPPSSSSMGAKGGSCAVSPEQMQHDRDTISQFLLTHKCYDIMPGTCPLSPAHPSNTRINACVSFSLPNVVARSLCMNHSQLVVRS